MEALNTKDETSTDALERQPLMVENNNTKTSNGVEPQPAVAIVVKTATPEEEILSALEDTSIEISDTGNGTLKDHTPIKNGDAVITKQLLKPSTGKAKKKSGNVPKGVQWSENNDKDVLAEIKEDTENGDYTYTRRSSTHDVIKLSY